MKKIASLLFLLAFSSTVYAQSETGVDRQDNVADTIDPVTGSNLPIAGAAQARGDNTGNTNDTTAGLDDNANTVDTGGVTDTETTGDTLAADAGETGESGNATPRDQFGDSAPNGFDNAGAGAGTGTAGAGGVGGVATANASVIPEPATSAMIGLGIAGGYLAKRRKKKQQL